MFRSDRTVRSEFTLSPRAALTTIYFLLEAQDRGRWHRVVGEEAWHFYEGDPLELLWLEPKSWAMDRRLLGPPADGREPIAVVPAGHWQAARSTGDYSLLGCTMGPGFEYADFAMLADRPEDAAELRTRHPDLEHLI